jgi:integrase
MALTHTAVSKAKAEDKPKKLTDGGGLYLLVKPSGFKGWKYDFRLNAKRGTFTIGSYPDISLKDARIAHQTAREHVAKGVNPKQIKVQQSIANELDTHRFSFYAKQWIAKQHMAESTLSDLQQRIDKNLIPKLDKKRVNEFTTLDLLRITEIVSNRGAKETALIMARVLRKVFNEILLLGVIESNPAQGLSELLPKPDRRQRNNFAHVTTTSELKALLLQIDTPSKRQDYAVTQALKLMPLVFLRPHNIRYLRWEYIDFESHQINIPASELKTRKPLTVPLATQAEIILKDMHRLTGELEYVFVSSRGQNAKVIIPLSENTTTKAIQRLINPITNKPFGVGYMTSHGFRHTASTMLNELGFDSDIIELQLAHIDKNQVRATYNKAQWMEKRINMMQAWANYLDGLKTQGNVTPINKRTSA